MKHHAFAPLLSDGDPSAYTQPALTFPPGLCVDLFAGGGGASLGLSRAYRDPDVAINHDATAVAVHRANHPHTQHFTCDVFEVDPVAATGGRPVGVLWASPDCRHHSKAAGRKPRSKRVRGLAWVVVKWASAVRPRLIHLENVEEFADWGPLLADGSPCPVRKGITFRRWRRQLERLGYVVEAREEVAANFGAPTTRKRLYVIARCDRQSIVWPAHTHAAKPAPGRLPWRTAAECIDWDIPACSIFATPAEARTWAKALGRGVPQRPLAAATFRRIAKGLWRYSIANPTPYIVPLRGTSASHTSVHDIDDPVSTVTAGGKHHALTVPHLVKFRGDSAGTPADAPVPTITAGGAYKREAGAAHALGIAAATMAPFLTEHANASTQRVFSIDEPLRTQCAQVKGGHFAMATAHLEQAAGGPNSNGSRPRSALEPCSTLTTKGSQQQIVTAFFVKAYSHGGQWSAATAPLGAITTKDRMGLVEVVHVRADIVAPEHRERARMAAAFLREYLPEHFTGNADYVVVGDRVLVDITLRMLVPRELARAQGFPDTYIIDRGLFETADGTLEWRPISKAAAVKLIGNSVCPDVAAALVAAQGGDPWMVRDVAA